MTDPLAFTIPSIHQETELHCRIYHPQNLKGPQKLGAIIAHPWASLGGSYDDPAVLAAVQVLVEKGYVVGTFNFRGARPSRGSGSWSGQPEVADYTSFIGFFAHYLEQLRWNLTAQSEGILVSSEGQSGSSANEASSTSAATKQAARRFGSTTLILGGYSYGAVILSNLPSLESILAQFSNSRSDSVHYQIIKTAAQLSAQINSKVPASSNSSSNRNIETRYLFVSPVAGTLRRFLHWGLPANDEMWEHSVLVIHGTKDHFTSVESVRKWIRSPRAEVRVVKNGHFWVESHTRGILMQLIGDWASNGAGQGPTN